MSNLRSSHMGMVIRDLTLPVDIYFKNRQIAYLLSFMINPEGFHIEPSQVPARKVSNLAVKHYDIVQLNMTSNFNLYETLSLELYRTYTV